MKIDVKDQIENKGWSKVENISSNNDLFELAKSIGKIIQHPNGVLMDTLVPSDGENSSKGSFSNRFGYDPFPLHTDTAFWAKPAKYMILFSEMANSCNSLIFDSNTFISSLSSKEYSLAIKAIFLVKTFNSQHFTSLIFKEENTIGFRYDPCCMIPVNQSAKEILKVYQDYFKRIKPLHISWTGNNAIILDNWRMLHGRSKVDNNYKRKINRIYLETIL